MKKAFLRMSSVLLLSGCSALGVFAQTASPSPHLNPEAVVVRDLADVGNKLLDVAKAMPADRYSWRPGAPAASASGTTAQVESKVVTVADGNTPETSAEKGPGQASKETTKDAAGAGNSKSVSEVFVLAAAQYYHLPSEWGLVKAAGYEVDGNTAQATGNLNKEPLEKTVKDKEGVMDQLFEAVSYFNGIVKELSDADLERPVKIRGQDVTTVYSSLVTMDGDVHEYLAEALVYAQMNGIVLPWMAERQEAKAERGWRTEVKRAAVTN